MTDWVPRAFGYNSGSGILRRRERRGIDFSWPPGSSMRKLRLFWLLAPAERWLTMEALLLPVAISMGFALLGVPRTQAWARRWALPGKRRSVTANPGTAIEMTCRAQRRVMRTTGVRGPCLVRSLTLWTMLLHSGIEAHLRVGFRKRDGKVQGHAWVEYNEHPINEVASETSTFAVYDEPVCFDLWRRQKARTL